MRIRFYINSCLLILLASYGCGGKISETDIKLAQEAMVQAKSFHADELAPTDFQQAQKAWDRAQIAAKEGRTDTAKLLFVTAKIDFHKSIEIAKSKRDALSREIGALQLRISSDFDKVKSDLAENYLTPELKAQVKAITSEVERGNASISKLVDQEELLQAIATAKNVQTKVYNAQVILDGQRPPS